MAKYSTTPLSKIRSGFRIDAEFYRPKFVELDRIIADLRLKEIGLCARVTDGEHGSVDLATDGIKYLTAENIRQGYVDLHRVRYVGARVDERNARARVREGDVLVSIKGTLGEVALAEKDVLPANMNRDVAIIKIHSHVNGGYLTAFLRSRFGAYQLEREGSGGVQQMITLERLRTIRLVLLPEKQQSQVERLQLAGLECRRESKRLFSDAEHLLEAELGLDRLRLENSAGKNYTVQLSDLEASQRMDAQRFQPRFTQLMDHLSALPLERIRDIRTFNRRGLQPIYVSNGGVNVVNSAHLGSDHVDYEGLQKTDAASYALASEGHIRREDLLIYTTGAYVGRTNVYLHEAPALASNHVKDTDRN